MSSPQPANASPEKHKASVCSVLLPLYPASDAQKHDVYKGYDKITTSPTHKATLPRWNIPQEKIDKYRGHGQ